MPISLAASLRRQADACLRMAKLTTDEVFRAELVSTADWLCEKADRFETPDADLSSAAQRADQCLVHDHSSAALPTCTPIRDADPIRLSRRGAALPQPLKAAQAEASRGS
jgi:hypothetical protein